MYSSYSFLTSPLDGVSGQHHTLASLYPQGKDPLVPLDRRLGGPQHWSGQRLEEKSLPLPGIELQLPGLQSDTILTELPQLLIICL
jgi:hypothetical protein